MALSTDLDDADCVDVRPSKYGEKVASTGWPTLGACSSALSLVGVVGTFPGCPASPMMTGLVARNSSSTGSGRSSGM